MIVNPIPTVSITASATTICAGQSVTFVATPTNAGPSPSYQWYINSVPVGPNANVFTTSGLNNGDVVTCVVTSTAGCSDQTLSRSNAIVMTVNPIPSVLYHFQRHRFLIMKAGHSKLDECSATLPATSPSPPLPTVVAPLPPPPSSLLCSRTYAPLPTAEPPQIPAPQDSGE